MGRAAFKGVLAAAVLAACGCASARPASSLTGFFKVLDGFADGRRMSVAGVAGAFHTHAVSADGSAAVVFASVDLGAGLHINSLELTGGGEMEAVLDIFPGATCITPADVEAAYGRGAARSAIVPDGGVELAFRRPAKVSRDWPAADYGLTFDFSGAGRCATQITVNHGRK